MTLEEGPKMKLKKYIVVVPIVEMELALLRFGENRYTWVPFWDDLRELDGKCIFDEFKIFVDQEDLASSPPKLFVCTLTKAEGTEKAYEQGTQAILALSNRLVILLGQGFEPIQHEAIVVDLTPIIKDTIDVKLVELTTKNGNVESIATPYGVWKSNFPIPLRFSHNEYVTLHSKVQKIEEGNIGLPTAKMVQKDVLLNIEANLKRLGAFKSNDERELMNVIATLYSAAIITSNISISYLLLWQVLESFAASKEAGGKLLTRKTLNSIKRLLQEECYDTATVKKVSSRLGMLREKTEVQMIAEMLREYSFPGNSVDVLEQKVEEFRKIRGAITHPRLSGRLDANELLTNYKELRGIIDNLLQKLRYSENCLEA